MKTIYIIYCALILLAVFSVPASAEMVGDANNDGIITTADSVLTLEMSVGSSAPDIERADASDDGNINALDSLMICTMAQDMQDTPETQVCVNAPDVVSGTFNVTIEVNNAVDLDSGQFDLSFDPSVVNVTDVYNGSIDGTAIPVGNWTVMHGTDNWDCDKLVRVVFDMPEVTGVSGSGHLVTIHFEVTGAAGDRSVLDISDGLLVNTGSGDIPAVWINDEVSV